ncbi:MAG: PorP/SprF family type IX secretion system membrane protein [Bacteroidales bacterium]|jgi:type IX secretion system PorP/SprF family membrane protein|nr:PorP/SprF family type IX secretion system membrane protein [Bacteroidales bacterium]
MRKVFLIILVFYCNQLYSQDIEFSQYYANPLYLNPAFAGSDDMSRIYLNYRTMLPSSFGDFSTYSASYDQYLDGIGGGLGFQIMNDRQAQGTINALNFNIIYAYHFQLRKKWSFSLGLQAGYDIHSFNTQNLIFPDMIDESTGGILENTETGIDQKAMFFDFAAGFLTWYENYYVGFSVDHLTKPISSLGTQYKGIIGRKYTLHGGVDIPLYNSLGRVDMTFSPNLIFQLQDDATKINLGLYLTKKLITGGVWLKTNTQFNLTGAVLMLGVTGDYSSFAYSYDVPFYLGGISGVISGSHEVTFLYKFKYKSKRKKMQAIKCPKI